MEEKADELTWNIEQVKTKRWAPLGEDSEERGPRKELIKKATWGKVSHGRCSSASSLIHSFFQQIFVEQLLRQGLKL